VASPTGNRAETGAIHQQGRTYPIWALLIALSLPALIGASWFGIVESSAAAHSAAQSNDVQESTEHLVLLTELRTKVLDERYWDSADRGIAQIGITPDLVATLTGLNFADELEQTRSRVDELVTQLDRPDIGAELDSIRTSSITDLSVRNLQYADIESSLKAETDAIFDDVLRTIGGMESEEGITDALRVFEEAAEARQAIAHEFTLYFSAQFDNTTDATADTQLLISLHESRLASLDDIDRIASPTSSVQPVLRELRDSLAGQQFDDSIADLIEQSFAAGAADADGLQGILGRLDNIALFFSASSESIENHFTLVGVAAEDVSSASAEMSGQASARFRNVLMSSLALVLTSLFLVALAQRAIARPSHELAIAASRIRNGQFAANGSSAGGPREIKAAGNAIQEAAANLDLAERQARALADGELDHVSLTEPTTGSLGSSLQTAVRTLATSLQLKQQFQRELVFEAAHDGLTQIANRRESLAQLEARLSSTPANKVTSVLFVDLDDFKKINDGYGHQVGDELLCLVASRLHAAAGPTDHVGRLGGDEFIILAETDDLDGACELAQTVVRSLKAPIDSDLVDVQLEASIGVAVGSPGTAANEVLRKADLALYRSKSDPDCRIQPFDEAFQAEISNRAELAHDLDRALKNANMEFVLHHQPIMDSQGNKTVGCEALLRWRRPDHGLVFPDPFIPFAEESELIIRIDQWVLSAAVGQLQYMPPGQMIHVNISGRHLARPSFVEDVLSSVRNKIAPGQLVLEVTESALVENLEAAAEKLNALREEGLLVAIDDFGTGYTSLAELRTLPVDILKIDKSFINDDSASALVQLIIDTGHHLGAQVVAEGIETEQQSDRLRNMGVDALQGYFFARPAEPDFGFDMAAAA